MNKSGDILNHWLKPHVFTQPTQTPPLLIS